MHDWRGWTFLLVYFAASLAISLDLMWRDPARLASDVLILLGFAGIHLASGENSFASVTIELASDQGLYRAVSMPSCDIRCMLMLSEFPIALGSW